MVVTIENLYSNILVHAIHLYIIYSSLLLFNFKYFLMCVLQVRLGYHLTACNAICFHFSDKSLNNFPKEQVFFFNLSDHLIAISHKVLRLQMCKPRCFFFCFIFFAL